MIPNITRGRDFRGLMRYLVGPGKRNEHTIPHLIAGDTPLMTWFDNGELSKAAAVDLAKELERPSLMRGDHTKAGPVWHCSLSLPSEDGRFTDEQWAQVAYRFLDKMGWTPEVSGRSPMPWLAVHHGTSTAGNDHIHLVVSLVREDGTRVNIHNDQPKAQQACRDLEKHFGIRELEGAALGISERGLKPAEVAIAERTGIEPAQRRLEREVRAASTAALSEAEFVESIREAGLRIAPYFAAGRNDVVAGYRVGLPGVGERMYGGGHLARDLTLPRLREPWPDTPEAQLAAAAAWRIADRVDRGGATVELTDVSVANREGEQTRATAQHESGVSGLPVSDRRLLNPDQVNRYMNDLQQRLRSLPVGDYAAWSAVARDTAGILAAWSRQLEGPDNPGPLAAAAQSVGRLGQTRQSAPGRPQLGPTVSAGASHVAFAISRGGQGKAAQAIFLRQLLNTMRAIHDTALTIRQLRIARDIRRSAVEDLRALQLALPAIPEWVFMAGCPTEATAESALTSGTRAALPAAGPSPRPLGRPLSGPVVERAHVEM